MQAVLASQYKYNRRPQAMPSCEQLSRAEREKAAPNVGHSALQACVHTRPLQSISPVSQVCMFHSAFCLTRHLSLSNHLFPLSCRISGPALPVQPVHPLYPESPSRRVFRIATQIMAASPNSERVRNHWETAAHAHKDDVVNERSVPGAAFGAWRDPHQGTRCL